MKTVWWNLVRIPKSTSVAFVCAFLTLTAILSCQSAYAATQVSQFGITWTFDRDYTVGQFANGDYWVVGPVNIIDINPGWNGESHGSMKNPMPIPNGQQAYDSRIVGWEASLRIDAPNTIDVNTSLISAISWTDADSEDPNYPTEVGGIPRPTLRTAAVLTVLGEVPDPNAFRPPYCGNNKPIYLTSNLRKDLLPDLALVANTPDVTDVAANFERVWLDHFAHVGDGTQYTSPSENMPGNGVDYSATIGPAALLLALDEDELVNQQGSNLDSVLIPFVQLGIDLYEVVDNNGYWWGYGSLNIGRKWPIIFAGLMLDNSDMKNIGTNSPSMSYQGFQEDSQVFYVSGHPDSGSVWTFNGEYWESDGTDEDYDIYIPNPDPSLDPNSENFDAQGYRRHFYSGNPAYPYYGHGDRYLEAAEYTEQHRGMPEWGIGHGAGDSYRDALDWSATYRFSNGQSYPGFVLAAHIMGQKQAWNHNALFDYMDRWIEVHNEQYSGPEANRGYYVYGGDFQRNMWTAYRADYGPIWPNQSANQSPVLQEIGSKSVNENTTLAFTVSATDGDGDTITYSATNLPSGATFSSPFSWTPGYSQAGSYQVTFIASDGSAQDPETITITVNNVNRVPVLAAIGNKSVNEGSLLSFSVSATDADGDTITYSAQTLPTGATFSNQTFSWTPSYSQAGSYQVTFIASDGQEQDPETITVTVGNTNRAPVLAAIGNKTVNENTTLNFSVSATDADGNPITYSVENLPGGAAFASQNFIWTPGYDQAGTFEVTFNASDGQDQDSETITITVSKVNRAPVLDAIADKSVDDGTLLTFAVNATDPDGDTIEYSATGLPSGAAFAGQTFNWTPAYSQADNSYQVTFIASDGQLQDSQAINIVVSDTSAPVVTNRSPAAGSIQTPLNSLIILHVTDAGEGVDNSSVTIAVDDSIVYTGNTDHYASSTGDCRRSGAESDYTFIYQSDEMLDFDQTVSVKVNAADLAGNPMPEHSYSFKTEMRSFGENKKVSSLDIGKSMPGTVCDSSGNIWVAWHAGPTGSRDIYLSKLTSGAGNFGAALQLTGNSVDQCNPAIALDDSDKLYVVWQDNRRGNWDIYVSTSDDGVNWSAETRVTDSNDNQINPAIVIDGQSPNRAYIAWQDDRNGNQDIYVATSQNSFLTATISQITSDTSNQLAPAITADASNTVYVVWTDARNASTDIYGAASDSGPWTNVVVVSNAYNQSSPAIAAESAGSVLHLLWVDDTSGDDLDIYYALSDGLPVSPLNGSSIIDDTSAADQSAPAIVTTGSTGNNLRVFACWKDGRNLPGSNSDTDLYFARLNSGSGTNVLVGDDSTNSSQSEPAMATDEYGHPYLVWTDGRSTNQELYYAGSSFVVPVVLESENVTASSGATVGTEPAAINDVDDVSAIVPSGACPSDVQITISRIENPRKHTLERLSLPYEFGPSGLEFDQPVTITIPYAVSGSTNTASVYWYNTLTGTLSQEGITNVETIVISPTLHALQFRTTHFTEFFIGGGIAAAVGGGGGGGGGGCSISATGQGSIAEFLVPYIGLAAAMVIIRLRDMRNRKARNIKKG